MPRKWRAFADTMRDGLSTRRAGARVDMSHKTAWRWRHKVMAFLAPTEQPALGGIVEADETYFRRNFKGSKPTRASGAQAWHAERLEARAWQGQGASPRRPCACR